MVVTRNSIKPRVIEATGWISNILLFGLPALGMVIAYYVISPALVPFMPLSEARMLAGSLVMVGLLVAALIGFLSEGHPRTFVALAERFRLTRLKKFGWLWALGGLVVYVVLAAIANTSVPLIYRAIGFTPPIETAEPWGLSTLPLVLVTLVLNILGEEIWWRGYILPRQELQFGKNADMARHLVGILPRLQMVDHSAVAFRLHGGALRRSTHEKHLAWYPLAPGGERSGNPDGVGSNSPETLILFAAVFCLSDEILKALHHHEDQQCRMRDSGNL